MTNPPESALDRCIDTNEHDVSGDLRAAARAELRALRERASDLELLLRESFAARISQHYDGRGRTFLLHSDRIHFMCASLADDGTGIPLLTPEARAALRSPR